MCHGTAVLEYLIKNNKVKVFVTTLKSLAIYQVALNVKETEKETSPDDL